MMDLDRILSEQQECARYLSDPDLCREWAQKYGCTVEHARDGARMGLADWVAEEVLERTDYESFLSSKRIVARPIGFEISRDRLNPQLFDFQRDIVHWALKVGRCLIAADCGLGKTSMQLEWAKWICAETGGDVLDLSPLAVSQQTWREGKKFHIPVNVCKTDTDIRPGINITNYERLHYFMQHKWAGIILDESSILKGFDGKFRKLITEYAQNIPYRLACTATPAPNDYMELGTHAEFFGVMTVPEMLSMFFVHDGGDTSKWRLKGHAQTEFWKWVASWAVAIRKPSDLGYPDDGFVLPQLHVHQITVSTDARPPDGYLFPVEADTLLERAAARKETIAERVAACASLVNGNDEPWLVWCNLNAESAALKSAIPEAVEVVGADDPDDKERAVRDFVGGDTRVLISKPTIFGYGINMQRCAHVAFVGLSDSYEQFYQAVRRCWRFGQKREVHCHIITAETEGAVVRNIKRKEQQAMEMMDGVVGHMREEMKRNIRDDRSVPVEQSELEHVHGNSWEGIKGDCIDAVRLMPADSVHYSIFSPPFASLYTYSNSDRDMGNAKDYEEFSRHFDFLVPELYRVLMPGRLLSFHCMNLPTTKERHGVIGVQDFRGDLIRMFQRHGFIFHSEVCIWKDPVTAMQRTKAIGLLYKQLKKDSSLSRQGIPDYLVTMRKPGENPERVTKTPDDFPVSLWQRYASPVWMDIDPSDTLQRESARENNDERHICPLQLEVIRRSIRLWTNPGDVVLDPFGGIGSTGVVAAKMNRRSVLVELKQSYFDQLCANLRFAEKMAGSRDLFSDMSDSDISEATT